MIPYIHTKVKNRVIKIKQLIKESERGRIYAENDSGGKKIIKRVTGNGNTEVYELLMNAPCPYIPRIYSVTGDESETVITEEYINGRLLSETCFSERDMSSAAMELCRALIHIHKLGIVHRDIKPSNILMADDGHIRLIDFDAARTVKPAADSDTRYLGTEGFAPPEQYGFSQTDRRSDIYALGKTLECIFGSLSYDKKYRRIIEKCTRLDPEERYADASEILKALSGNTHTVKIISAAVLIALSAAVMRNTDSISYPAANTSALPVSAASESPVTTMTETSPAETAVTETSPADIAVTAALPETALQPYTVTSEHTPGESSERITETASDTAVAKQEDIFSEYNAFYKNLDVNRAHRLTEAETKAPLLFTAAEGIPMDYIIISAEALRENKYAAMLCDRSGDGYDDLFQLSAYSPPGQNEYFRRLCVAVTDMYDGYPDFHVISDNTYFTSLVSILAMEQETGMLKEGQYVQLSVLDVNSDGGRDVVLSMGECGNIINTQVFYYSNIGLEYTRSGTLNLYLHSTEQMICEGNDRIYTSDGSKIYSLTLDDTIETFRYIDPWVYTYEADDDPLHQKFRDIMEG